MGNGFIPGWMLCPKVSAEAKLVYVAMSRYLGCDIPDWPSRERLAWETSLHAVVVERAIRELEGGGFVTHVDAGYYRLEVNEPYFGFAADA